MRTSAAAGRIEQRVRARASAAQATREDLPARADRELNTT
jgi:hypothetical protein